MFNCRFCKHLLLKNLVEAVSYPHSKHFREGNTLVMLVRFSLLFNTKHRSTAFLFQYIKILWKAVPSKMHNYFSIQQSCHKLRRTNTEITHSALLIYRLATLRCFILMLVRLVATELTGTGVGSLKVMPGVVKGDKYMLAVCSPFRSFRNNWWIDPLNGRQL